MVSRKTLAVLIAIALFLGHSQYVEYKCSTIMFNQRIKRNEIMQFYINANWPPHDVDLIYNSLIAFDKATLQSEGCLK